MPPGADIRAARDEDLEPCFRVFRRSLFTHLHRIGLATGEEARDPPIASAWRRQEGWIRHLWSSAAENWVAVGPDGIVSGWAMSIARVEHRELTHFFVDPGSAGQGNGAALLAKAFSADERYGRSVLATQDPSALSLYQRAGLSHVTTSVDILVSSGSGESRGRPRSLTMRPVERSDVGVIADLEDEIIGFRREVDLSFILTTRPAWIAERQGRPVGYAFGAQQMPADTTDFSPTCGPMGAVDPVDIVEILDHVVAEGPAGHKISLCVPMTNTHAMRHLLDRGGTIDPFFICVLSDHPTMKLDRFVHTSPSFIL